MEKQDRILILKFNNPKKKNCLNRNGYQEIARVLKECSDDENISIVVFTGVGDFYTAGNDLKATDAMDDMDAYIAKSNAIFKDMVQSFIACKKVIVSLVNGPCIGIGTTLAALSDLIWCSDKVFMFKILVKLCIFNLLLGLLFSSFCKTRHCSRSWLFILAATHSRTLQGNGNANIWRKVDSTRSIKV